ncbi:MAG: prepilin peptidase [Clostridiales bacterium]|nr:prepilin peptidase [Clostridiales bacterium]
MFIVYLIVFLYGISIGSFLNVVIYRVPLGKNVAKGRSYCPVCGNTLSWMDLFPLLSFVILKGKCRYCGTKISWQYPIVEGITGIGFVFIFYLAGINAKFFILLFIWVSIIILLGISYNKKRMK